MNAPPLDGIRVLDLSRILAGPWCTQTLADLGAEVIKVESPGAGDDTRSWGSRLPNGSRSYFMSANRSKQSIAIDLASPEGQKVIRELAAQSDILVENFKYGGLAKYGLDYDQLAESCPKLIYCSISGYGRKGPSAARAGYDFIIQAEAGLMSITGAPDGEPQKVGVAVSDIMAGMYAVQGILAAVIARGKTGRGQHIDISLFDCTLANMANVASSALNAGTKHPRLGNAHPDIVPYQLLPAKNGDMVVAVGNDSQFRRFATEVLERPELAKDPRFITNPSRLEHRAELIPEITKTLRTRDREYWLDAMAKRQIPGGVVCSMAEALATPDAAARDMVKTVPHAVEGTLRVTGSPLKLSDTPVREPGAPPVLGQHTDDVLKAVLGYDQGQIAALRQAGAIG